jgi:hypothetical protein
MAKRLRLSARLGASGEDDVFGGSGMDFGGSHVAALAERTMWTWGTDGVHFLNTLVGGLVPRWTM